MARIKRIFFAYTKKKIEGSGEKELDDWQVKVIIMSPEFLSYRGLNIQFCLFSLFNSKDLISNIWWHLLILFLFCLSYTMKPVSCFLWLVRVMKLFQECWSVNICSELIKMRFLKNKINPSYMPLLTMAGFFQYSEVRLESSHCLVNFGIIVQWGWLGSLK